MKEGAKIGMRRVSEEVVQVMISSADTGSHGPSYAAFGISYNTWRKIREGQLIRQSVANRLEQRVLSRIGVVN